MKLVVNEAKNSVSWGAVWSPDKETPPTLTNVMAILGKSQFPKFKEEVEKQQANMP
jgi:hypothetical protein